MQILGYLIKIAVNPNNRYKHLQQKKRGAVF